MNWFLDNYPQYKRERHIPELPPPSVFTEPEMGVGAPGIATNYLLANQETPGAASAPGNYQPITEMQPSASNALIQREAPVPAAPPPDTFTDYWKQPVVGKVPLDMFTQVAGMAAHAFAPDTPSGRLGASLANMGAGAYGERIRREYEGPNKLLQQRYLGAQISGAEAAARKAAMEESRDADVQNAIGAIDEGITRGTIPASERTDRAIRALEQLGGDPKAALTLRLASEKERVANYHFTEDDQGNPSVFVDGVLKHGTGRGKSKDDAVLTTGTNAQGDVTVVYKNGKRAVFPGIGKPTESGNSVMLVSPTGEQELVPKNSAAHRQMVQAGWKPYGPSLNKGMSDTEMANLELQITDPKNAGNPGLSAYVDLYNKSNPDFSYILKKGWITDQWVKTPKDGVSTASTSTPRPQVPRKPGSAPSKGFTWQNGQLVPNQ